MSNVKQCHEAAAKEIIGWVWEREYSETAITTAIGNVAKIIAAHCPMPELTAKEEMVIAHVRSCKAPTSSRPLTNYETDLLAIIDRLTGRKP